MNDIINYIAALDENESCVYKLEIEKAKEIVEMGLNSGDIVKLDDIIPKSNRNEWVDGGYSIDFGKEKALIITFDFLDESDCELCELWDKEIKIVNISLL